MERRITLAHDIICPWCWVGLFQVKKMTEEFGVTVDWVGYELFPENLEWPVRTEPDSVHPNKPVTPTRMELAYAAQGMEPPTAERPKQMRSHNVLEACAFAQDHGHAIPFIEAVYRAYWEEGKNVNDVEVLCEIAQGFYPPEELRSAILAKQYDSRIVKFDDDAYAAGIYNVPTFIIDGKKYAEQPYSVLANAIKAWIG